MPQTPAQHSIHAKSLKKIPPKHTVCPFHSSPDTEISALFYEHVSLRCWFNPYIGVILVFKSGFWKLAGASAVCCLHRATFSVASSRRARAAREARGKTRTRETCALPVPLTRWSSHALRVPAQSRVHTLVLRRSSQAELLFFFSHGVHFGKADFPSDGQIKYT